MKVENYLAVKRCIDEYGSLSNMANALSIGASAISQWRRIPSRYITRIMKDHPSMTLQDLRCDIFQKIQKV